jgi:hypothetical protein
VAAICNQQVTALVGAGSETQFKFRGVPQEEKPLRDWLQEVLMNCLGYYTFSFGKLKIGVRVNSSTVEAFTIGNIVFNSLQLAPLKPSFDHLTANFADQDYKFVNNSVTVYDIDRATLLGGAAGPLFLKSNVNLSGTCTKSQAARIISIRLRESPWFRHPTQHRHRHDRQRGGASIARFVFEFRECRQKVGCRGYVVTCEFHHQTLHCRGAVHAVSELPRHPNCRRDQRQAHRHIDYQVRDADHFIGIHVPQTLQHDNQERYPPNQLSGKQAPANNPEAQRPQGFNLLLDQGNRLVVIDLKRHNHLSNRCRTHCDDPEMQGHGGKRETRLRPVRTNEPAKDHEGDQPQECSNACEKRETPQGRPQAVHVSRHQKLPV